jgi:hypothetical protein
MEIVSGKGGAETLGEGGLPDCAGLELNGGAREDGSSNDFAFLAAVHDSFWDGGE